MAEITRQAVIFSNSPVLGYFRFKDRFQIHPLPLEVSPYAKDYPLIIEVTFDPEVYPERSEGYWHRDLWEEERFERIRRQSDNRKMELDDPWVEAYQAQSRFLRWPAIWTEVTYLFTFFSRHRFFSYEKSQGWFVSIKSPESTDDATYSVWGHHGFRSEYGGEIDGLTDPDCDPLPLVNQNEFARRFRDTKGYSRPDQVEFPITMQGLLNQYFSLTTDKKLAFYTSIHFYCQALYYKHRIPSLSLIASVMAIERIMNLQYGSIDQCSECSAPISIEKCPTCQSPLYRLRSRFRKFMSKYSLPDQDALYKDMYDARSRISHGELLREDLFDTGFFAGESDNEELLRRNSLICVNDALLHWLVKQEAKS